MIFSQQVSKQVVMPLCVAGVELREILTCLQKCPKSMCATAPIVIIQGFQGMTYILGGKHSTLEISIVILRGRHTFTLYHTLHSTRGTFFSTVVHSALHSTLYALNSHPTLHTIYSTPHTFTLHFTVYTLHSRPHTLQLYLLHTIHSTHRTSHPTLKT